MDIHIQDDKFKNIVDNNTDGVIIVDSKEVKVLFANNVAKDVFAIQENDILEHLLTLPPEQDDPEEIEVIGAENQSLIAEINICSIEWEEETAYMVTLRNVTECRSIAKELQASQEQYSNVFQQLQEANVRLESTLETLTNTQMQVIQQERLRALGEMASGIAHDFNNALMPILGFSELLLQNSSLLKNESKVRTYLETIHTAASDASLIVKRLREFYRKREENEVLEQIDINSLVKQAIILTQPRWETQAKAQGKDIDIETHFEKLPLFATNPSELREVLTNLIFNAVDAMPNGGTITISTYTKDNNIAIQIQDTGIGMSEETYKRCLEPFYTTKKEGCGLGLAVVYGIIKRNDGTIDISSTLGVGTTFTLQFPIQNTYKQETETLKLTLPKQQFDILLVEDAPSVREVLTESLTIEGHNVTTANDGEEALHILETTPNFDLIITDRILPELNGDELAEEVKEKYPNILIVLLSGLESNATPPYIDLVLEKPLDLNELRYQIYRLFQQHHNRSASGETTDE